MSSESEAAYNKGLEGPEQDPRVPSSRPRAWVIGAGVAGMTAAHELASRDFAVTVIEPREDPRFYNRTPLLGGLAATQFCRSRVEVDGEPAGDRRSAAAFDLCREDNDVPTSLPRARMRRWPRLRLSDQDPRADDLDKILPVVARNIYRHSRPGRTERLILAGTWTVEEHAQENRHALAEARAQKVGLQLKRLLSQLGVWVELLPLREGEEGDPEPPDGPHRHVQLLRQVVGRVDQSMEDDDYMPEERDKVGQRYSGVPAPSRLMPYVGLVMAEQLLPGEHGYRFFPGFYKHTFDTMERTPVLSRETPWPMAAALERALGLPLHEAREHMPTPETVFDNLTSIPQHAIATEDGRPPTVLPRVSDTSISSFMRMIESMQEQIGMSREDMALGSMRTLHYLTSSSRRRQDYETITWSEFSKVHQGSEGYVRALTHWPQALVGLRSELADARTFGSVLLQMVLDHVNDNGYRDGTLNGPTSEAWFDHWRDAMRHSHDVTFAANNRLERVSFDRHTKRMRLGMAWPLVLQDFEQGGAYHESEPGPDGLHEIEVGLNDYVVFAMPIIGALPVAARLWADLMEDPAHWEDQLQDFELSPFKALLELVSLYLTEQFEGGRSDWRGVRPEHVELFLKRAREEPESLGPFEHYNGIQFFLQQDYRFYAGHIYYPDSDWRLSSVSQGQFRRDSPSGRAQHRGVLSAVIGTWTEPAAIPTDRPGGVEQQQRAWDCSPDEVADAIWKQLRAGLQGAEPLPANAPTYHIDEAVRFVGDPPYEPDRPRLRAEKGVVSNRDPYTVNLVELHDWWPEQPGAYEVHFGQAAFAGTWMSTYTRLVTMESANESGRHAVNAILEDQIRRGKEVFGHFASIFDPEKHEPEDLQWLTRLDAELFERGLPHFMDILDIETFVMAAAREEQGHPTTLMEAVMEAVRVNFGSHKVLVQAVLPALKGLLQR